jgi:hypothetical protein
VQLRVGSQAALFEPRGYEAAMADPVVAKLSTGGAGLAEEGTAAPDNLGLRLIGTIFRVRGVF